MEINNFGFIRSHLKFNNKNEFYFIQIIQRKKDGNEGLRVRNGFRLIKSYYIYSLEEFDNLFPRIVELCINNNARAYININVRNAQEVALECIKKYSSLVLDNNAFMGNAIWDSCCGSTRARGYKAQWIVDIDTKDNTTLETIIHIILNCKHSEHFDYWVNPTKNGYHIICPGFDSKTFNSLLDQAHIDKVDIHKNNPTLLYFNDLSSN